MSLRQLTQGFGLAAAYYVSVRVIGDGAGAHHTLRDRARTTPIRAQETDTRPLDPELSVRLVRARVRPISLCGWEVSRYAHKYTVEFGPTVPGAARVTAKRYWTSK